MLERLLDELSFDQSIDLAEDLLSYLGREEQIESLYEMSFPEVKELLTSINKELDYNERDYASLVGRFVKYG